MVSLEQRLAALELAREAEAKAALFASRSDLPASLVKILETKPLAEAKAIVESIAKAAPPKPAAATTVKPTRGEGQGDGGASHLPPAEKATLDAKMGLVATTAGVEHRGTKLILGASMPVAPAKS